MERIQSSSCLKITSVPRFILHHLYWVGVLRLQACQRLPKRLIISQQQGPSAKSIWGDKKCRAAVFYACGIRTIMYFG